MDHQHLRAILIRLQDHLSDDDRRRLHFFLGDDVPRRIRDDPTLSGTLSLMESLFDQDKINEQDFTLLIHAFQQIRCVDAVKLLQEHRRRMQSNHTDEARQSLATIMSCTTDRFMPGGDDEEDRVALPNVFLDERTHSARYNQINGQKTTFDNSAMTNNDEGGIDQIEKLPKRSVEIPSSLEQETPIKTSSVTKKIIIILAIIIGFLVLVLVGLTVGIFILKGQLKEKIYKCFDEQMKTNETIEYLKDLRLKDNSTIQEITKKTSHLQDELQTTIGSTCGCQQWCAENRHTSYGVCGDGHTCICTNQPVTKENVGSGCTCDTWCRKYGYKNGGICGDGYTCICSM